MLEILLWLVVVAVLALAAGLYAHRLFEGECLPLDLWQEWRLSRASLEAMDLRWQGSEGRRADIVVSLTTIPSRIEGIDDTLKSLMAQSRPPRRIVLNLPAFSRREQVAYAVPERLTRLKSVEIRACDDWGPATKLIPTLLAEAPDQAIVVVDDDRIYPPSTIAVLERHAKTLPDAALALAGWVVPADHVDRPTTVLSNLLMRPPAPVRGTRLRQPRRIDVVLGFMSYLVRPRFFDLAAMTDFAQGPEALFFVDDVRTSALCAAPKYAVPTARLSFIPKRRVHLYARTALGLINRGRGGDESRHNSIAVRHFAGRWLVDRDGASS
jgi:hypothetical protein